MTECCCEPLKPNFVSPVIEQFCEVLKIPSHDSILMRTVDQNDWEVGFIEFAEEMQTDLPSLPKPQRE